ncbi:hypothetical protein [Nostoc sp. GT001]|uniref:hypothetical protein n=1 Tax=Nostoc sp. GT001 TaxID=3056647 RepID=UPI0025AAFBE2|nr:hypothetical protein [Nostoc sp. GT001]MDM9582323.1 hypothetical protein [Nostoc sp. GT001]
MSSKYHEFLYLIMFDRYYKLEGHTPVAVNFEEWAIWRTEANTQVLLSVLKGYISVSTIFLGINLGTNEKPQIFESLVTGGSCNGEKRLYSTWDEAISGHFDLIIQSIATTPEPNLLE